MGEKIGNISDVRGGWEISKPDLTAEEIARQLKNSTPIDTSELTGKTEGTDEAEGHQRVKIDKFGGIVRGNDKES